MRCFFLRARHFRKELIFCRKRKSGKNEMQKLRAGEGSAWSFFETKDALSLKMVRESVFLWMVQEK